jgi:hypothetical protein
MQSLNVAVAAAMIVGEATRQLGGLPTAKRRAKDGDETAILLRSLREGAMSKVLDYIKAALQIAFSLVVLAIILLNFQGFTLRRGDFSIERRRSARSTFLALTSICAQPRWTRR